MPLDPEMARHLAQLGSARSPSYADGTVQEARARLRSLSEPTAEAAGGVRVIEEWITGDARPIRLMLYRPAGPQPGGRPLPILMFLHGGGWVLGDVDSYDALCRDIAYETGCLLICVDYALAPEHRFPAAVTDCYAATAWAADHGGEYGGDPARLAVFGESAGGNLAAAVTLIARAEGRPRIGYQFLVYPVTDLSMTGGSYAEFADGFGLSRRDLLWFRGHYLGSAHSHRDPLAAPLRAADHRDLPPALIVTAEFDPLRDEGEAYAGKLLDAGVSVKLRRCDGLVHGFLDHMDVVRVAKNVFLDLAVEIRSLMAPDHRFDHECA